MENFFSRYKNPLVLMAVLFVQVIALATQVKAHGPNSEGPLLIRVWTVTAITPFERAFVGTGHFFRNAWNNYIDLHNVRRQNRQLQEELGQVRLENARLKSDVDQNRRLQALLDFREKFIAKTLAAQVIGTGGTEQSHVLYIDKGAHYGLKPDMAVITPDGIVGKIREVYPVSAQVLLINDHESGAGVVLENSRLQGVLHGSDLGDLSLSDIMSDEKVDVGERIITSGGDRIYPKGLPVGTVRSVGQDSEGPFLAIKVKPAADLSRLEEVLVITQMAEQAPLAAESQQPRRASEVLSQRLPSIPKPQDNDVKKNDVTKAAAVPGTAGPAKPAASPSTTPNAAGAGDAARKKVEVVQTNKNGQGQSNATESPKPKPPAKQPSPSPQPSAEDPEKPPR